jgi:hypothetical protein
MCAKLTTNMSHQQWRDWVSPDIDYIKVRPDLPITPDAPRCGAPGLDLVVEVVRLQSFPTSRHSSTIGEGTGSMLPSSSAPPVKNTVPERTSRPAISGLSAYQIAVAQRFSG